jgi:hypothetical protein
MTSDHNQLHELAVQTRNGSNAGALAPPVISRRDLVGGIGGALAALMLSAKARAADSKAKRLIAETRILEVNGRPARPSPRRRRAVPGQPRK